MDVAQTFLDRPKSMESKQYPQFLLIGDSIIQYSSFLLDGFSFGAALEERESETLGIVSITLALSHCSYHSLQPSSMLQQSDSC
jgi:hypothetical protein